MSGDGTPAPNRTVFESLGRLYAPADDPDGCAIVEADERWRVEPAAFGDARSVVWGRAAARRASPSRLLAFAAARELGLRRIARTDLAGLRLRAVHRLAPIARPGRLRRVVRFATMSGLLVLLGRQPSGRRVVDAVAERAGHPPAQPVHVRPSGDGSALARVDVTGATPAELRLGTIGGLKDPRRNAAALEHLASADVRHVPRLLASGEDLGVRWSIETLVPGSTVRRLSPSLVADTVRWCATLPRSGGAATAVEEHLDVVAGAFPRWADAIRGAADRVRPVAGAVPGVTEHGDLWIGNLLATDGRLTGVVDWDTWHPAGMPGVDLLHLLAMERRSRTGRELGELWLERPWAEAHYRDATAPYWSALGLTPSDELLWAVAVDWWAAHASAALRRGRRPTEDPGWVARNIDNVCPVLATDTRRSRSSPLVATAAR